MYKLLISIKIISYIIFIFTLFINLASSSDNNLKEANILFDNGKYLDSVNLASENLSIESYIFRARTLAIYGHFLLDGEEAMQVFKQAKELAFLALDIDNFDDNAHVEAAHTMGRYSQLIGIVSALKEGYAEKISFHLDEAIKINPNNVSAQISKGTWHAEIVDKAGFMANILYGATADQAREHYENALNLAFRIIEEVEIEDIGKPRDLKKNFKGGNQYFIPVASNKIVFSFKPVNIDIKKLSESKNRMANKKRKTKRQKMRIQRENSFKTKNWM